MSSNDCIGPNASPVLTQNLYDYFQAEVSALAVRLGRPVPPDAQIYLANLCSRFTSGEKSGRSR